MADKAEEFWTAFEKDTGEKVESRAMGQYFKPGDKTGLWGLLVLTDKSFRFKHLPSDNWMVSLFRRFDSTPTPKTPVEVTIARGDIVSLISPKRGLLDRIFGPAFPQFTVTGRGADGEDATTYRFAVDPTNGFIAELEKAIGR